MAIITEDRTKLGMHHVPAKYQISVSQLVGSN